MSLADELLADLEDGDEQVDEFMVEDIDIKPDIKPSIKPIEDDIKAVSIHQLATLSSSDRLKYVMGEIEKYQSMPHSIDIVGPVEADSEYQLIVEANNLAVEIDNEIVVIHRFTREKYSKRFPELESLVASPLEYMMTVRELGNDLDQAKNNEKLQQFLTPAIIMVVSITASTAQGQPLTDQELHDVFEACDMAAELNRCKQQIYEYVESRMTFIAPNLSAIVGASTAAKLMGVAGGLTSLSKMPACNVQLLGSQKKTLAGFAQASILPNTGFIFYSDFVESLPAELRKKAARIIAAKSTLAARVDACHEAPDGNIGRMLREEIEKKFDKLTEPPPVKFVKPLPKPIDPSRKKRGGKRVRKNKERYAMTELRKQANRLNFAEIDDDAYQDDLGYSRGTIGKTGTGRIRAAQVDEKTKVRVSKTLQKHMQKQQVYGGSTTVKRQISGTASSVAFTPLQGLEIVNPQAAEKRTNESSAKYFSNVAGFIKVKKSES